MTLPTSTVITGIDSLEILEQDLEAVKTFQPLTEKQVADLLARTREAASEGRFERVQDDQRVRRDGETPRVARRKRTQAPASRPVALVNALLDRKGSGRIGESHRKTPASRRCRRTSRRAFH